MELDVPSSWREVTSLKNPSETLPWEIFTFILSLLSPHDLSRCMRVSNFWHQGANNNFVSDSHDYFQYFMLYFFLKRANCAEFARFGMLSAKTSGQIRAIYQRYTYIYMYIAFFSNGFQFIYANLQTNRHLRANGCAQQAYKDSIRDSTRDYITKEELCSFEWSFRFKSQAGT